jgi:predicted nucleic acid-binding protein
MPMDTQMARLCARLHVSDRRSDRDALIAATAQAHGLAVVTRNTADFVATAEPVGRSMSQLRRRPCPTLAPPYMTDSAVVANCPTS